MDCVVIGKAQIYVIPAAKLSGNGKFLTNFNFTGPLIFSNFAHQNIQIANTNRKTMLQVVPDILIIL